MMLCGGRLGQFGRLIAVGAIMVICLSAYVSGSHDLPYKNSEADIAVDPLSNNFDSYSAAVDLAELATSSVIDSFEKVVHDHLASEDATEYLQLTGKANNSYEQHQSGYDFGPSSITCSKCIEKGFDVSIEMMEHHISKQCMSPMCPIMAQICLIYSSHPDLVIGFISAQMGLGQVVSAYCMGNSNCYLSDMGMSWELVLSDWAHQKHMSKTIAAMGFATPEVGKAMKDILALTTSNGAFTTYRKVNVGSHVYDVGSYPDGSGIIHFSEHWIPASDTHSSECSSCLRAVSYSVIMDVHDLLVTWCGETDKQVNMDICNVWYTHVELTIGSFLSIVQPWKFAWGWCYAKEECSSQPSLSV